MVHTLLGTGDERKMKRAVTEILRKQNEDGGWSIFAGGPSNISASVKAYFACKLMGWLPDHPVMAHARQWILRHGGVVECNTFTKIYLCFFGQYEYDAVPAIPPELVLFPNWAYFNIYEISSWSRAILVPLSIAYAKKPFKKLAPENGIDELFVGGKTNAKLHLRWDRKILGWRNFFLIVDRLFHWAERVHIRPLRTIAIRKAEKWILERLEMSDGLGAIYPAMLNAILALRCLGYSIDDPQTIRAMDEFEKLGIEDEGIPDFTEPTFRMQPCMSPVWDTAYAVYALGQCGVSRTDPRLLKAAYWMLAEEVRRKGDWSVNNGHTEPSGWAFEYANEFYPDVDDTAMVMLALRGAKTTRADRTAPRRRTPATGGRSIGCQFAMQSSDGGWAAFDADNKKIGSSSTRFPFADHNAMLDPTADITGRVLESLAFAASTILIAGSRHPLAAPQQQERW